MLEPLFRAAGRHPGVQPNAAAIDTVAIDIVIAVDITIDVVTIDVVAIDVGAVGVMRSIVRSTCVRGSIDRCVRSSAIDVCDPRGRSMLGRSAWLGARGTRATSRSGRHCVPGVALAWRTRDPGPSLRPAFGMFAAPGLDPGNALFPHPTVASFDKDCVTILVTAQRGPHPVCEFPSWADCKPPNLLKSCGYLSNSRFRQLRSHHVSSRRAGGAQNMNGPSAGGHGMNFWVECPRPVATSSRPRGHPRPQSKCMKRVVKTSLIGLGFTALLGQQQVRTR